MQFDITKPTQSSARHVPVSKVRGSWPRRLWLYGIAIVAIAVLIFWGRGQVSAIEAGGQSESGLASLDEERRLVAAAQAGSRSGIELAERGLAFLADDRLELASILLQAAALKDPQYRDALVYAGYAELARADDLWVTAADEAERRTRTAATLLEQARRIDPIHGYTFELLTVAYENLGKTELAAEAKEKAELFAIR